MKDSRIVFWCVFLAGHVFFWSKADCPFARLENGNFEDYGGWKSTTDDGVVEMWSKGVYRPIPCFEGHQCAEIQSNSLGSIYQDVATLPGERISWSVAHRGRNGTDVMAVDIGRPGRELERQMPLLVTGQQWNRYNGTYTIPQEQNVTRFALTALQTASDSEKSGNLVDSFFFGYAAKPEVDIEQQGESVGTVEQYDEAVFFARVFNKGDNATDVLLNITLPHALRCIPDSVEITEGPKKSKMKNACGADHTIIVPLGDMPCFSGPYTARFTVEGKEKGMVQFKGEALFMDGTGEGAVWSDIVRLTVVEGKGRKKVKWSTKMKVVVIGAAAGILALLTACITTLVCCCKKKDDDDENDALRDNAQPEVGEEGDEEE